MVEPATSSPASTAASASPTGAVFLLRLVLIAVAYILTGMVGRLLLLSSGYVSPVWPAAGLALVALLVCGPRYWPGVWIGAFLLNLWLDVSIAGMAVASLTAAGTTLQALLGARLTRRLVDAAVPLAHEMDVWRFLLLAGPLACLLSASVGVAVLYGFGRLPMAEVGNQWLVWWVGDVLGVLLFAPVALLAWPGRPAPWARSGTRVALPLLITAALLAAGNLGLARLEESQAKEIATNHMEDISKSGFLSLPRYTQSLRSIERLFAASGEVTEQEFATFVERIIQLPGIRSVDWAPKITQAQRPAFESVVYRMFELDAHNRPIPAQTRPYYYPVQFLMPRSDQLTLQGLDHGFDASRRAAMLRAMETGGAASVYKSSIMRTGKPSIISFVPVFGYDMDTALVSREVLIRELRGYIVGVFDVEQLFAQLALDARQHRLDFRITDVTPDYPAQVLAGQLPAGSRVEWQREVDFGGRLLRLEMHPVDGYWLAGAGGLAQIYLGFSVLAGFLVTFGVLSGAGRTTVIANQVQQRTAELRAELEAREAAEAALRASEQDLDTTLHSIGDAVMTTDTAGHITRMNPVAEQLTGWQWGDARGRLVQEVFNIVNETTRRPAVIPVNEVLRTGKIHGLANHTVLISRDGSEYAIADSAAPIRGSNGELRGVVLVFHDVSQERAATLALQASEERYRQFFELSPTGVFVQCDGLLTFLNPQAVAMLGAQSQEELLGRPVLDFLHPDYKDGARERMRLLREQDTAVPALEQKWLRLDGSVFVGETTAVPYRYQDRPAALVQLQDISARKEVEDQLNRFFAISLDMLCILNADGYFIRVSPAFTHTLGWDIEALRAHPFTEFLHPDDVAASLAEVDRLRTGAVTYDFFNRYRSKDGSWRWLEWNAQMQESGLIYASARDVTGRRETEQRTRELNAELENRISERTSALEALNAKEQEVSAIVDNLFDCVISIDARGIVRSANPALETLLGYTAQELIGRNVSLLMPEPYRSEHDGYLENYLRTGKAHIIGLSREVEAQHKNGELIPFELTVNSYQVHGETFFTGTLHDIRERNQLITELTQARAAAEAANRAKSEFLANMSHEIRTPMNAIIGLSHLCLQTALDSKQRDYVAKVHYSAKTLLGIINDILDFSKIEAGKMTLEEQDFELHVTLASVDSLIGHLARDKGLHYDLIVASDVPSLLCGDPLRLGQVLLNLTGNAVKFTQQGSVTLSISLRADDGVRFTLEFSVKDTGIGLSPRQIERIFQPFSQADASTTREFGGTGLGLAICRRLVDMMGGQLWVDSVPGEGSDFRFTASFGHGVEGSAVTTASDDELAAARARLKGVRILLAEDNPFNQQVGLELLERVGATVTVVNNGYEALEALAKQRIDLVLMDVQMPEMDGYDATRHIRSNPRLSGLRVIAMTANAMAEDRQRCLDAGMDDFISKPIEPHLLYLKLASWITPESMVERTPEAGPAASVATAAQPGTRSAESAVIDLGILGGTLRNDPAKVRKFAIKFLQMASETLVEMDEVLARRDLLALGGLGHRLKSSARTVGALGFADLCQALELAGKAGDWPAAEKILPQLAPLLDRIAEQVKQHTR